MRAPQESETKPGVNVPPDSVSDAGTLFCKHNAWVTSRPKIWYCCL